MTTIAKRVQDLEAGLSPQEAVVQWWAAARSYGSAAAYLAWLVEHPEADPPTMLPRQVRSWAITQSEGLNREAVVQRSQQAQRALHIRTSLLEIINEWMRYFAQVDPPVLDLLEAVQPLVLQAKAPVAATSCWVETVARLYRNGRTWELGCERVAERVLGGEYPLFGDLEEALHQGQERCERLLHAYQQARIRKRSPLLVEPVDLAELEQWAKEEVSTLIKGWLAPGQKAREART
jgi:hypothetical protein